MSFIGLLSGAILFLLFGIFFLFLSLSTKRKWKIMVSRRVKNKKKRKRIKFLSHRLEKQKKKQFRTSLIFFFLVLLTAGSAAYSRYYQLTNLTADDADSLAKGYYFVGELEKQLKAIDNGANAEKTSKNMRDLSTQLTSVANRNASQGMSVEGQKMLNRHFTMTRNLGINISGQDAGKLEDPAYRESYLKDIQKVVTSQKKVFKEFDVNESALQQKK
ncbi:hypothetical protein A5821_002687 [Enterococcus sp. 7F3_DIV0205]|uniref:Uncharacterized protein n=2 Tax=Candidatus Enterococcus palustris TaxID=1834189 RepID=A0AAQ3Y5Z1_9ENTE|nr:hypothetical protein A5821_003043 [Enterococcus sp. 7F3_DIV0205]